MIVESQRFECVFARIRSWVLPDTFGSLYVGRHRLSFPHPSHPPTHSLARIPLPSLRPPSISFLPVSHLLCDPCLPPSFLAPFLSSHSFFSPSRPHPPSFFPSSFPRSIPPSTPIPLSPPPSLSHLLSLLRSHPPLLHSILPLILFHTVLVPYLYFRLPRSITPALPLSSSLSTLIFSSSFHRLPLYPLPPSSPLPSCPLPACLHAFMPTPCPLETQKNKSW